MAELKWEDLFELIENDCDAVIVDRSWLCFPAIDPDQRSVVLRSDNEVGECLEVEICDPDAVWLDEDGGFIVIRDGDEIFELSLLMDRTSEFGQKLVALKSADENRGPSDEREGDASPAPGVQGFSP